MKAQVLDSSIRIRGDEPREYVFSQVEAAIAGRRRELYALVEHVGDRGLRSEIDAAIGALVADTVNAAFALGFQVARAPELLIFQGEGYGEE